MSHEVESMMYDKEEGDPWHLEETGDRSRAITAECKTNWHAALTCAGLDWTKSHLPAYFRREDGTLVECGDTLAVVRDTDGKYLGSVGSGTGVLQNKDALAWFQPFLDTGMVHLDTAGSLREGKVVWAQAKILGQDGSDIVSINGDEVSKRILLAFAHDNTMGVNCGFSPTRIVCMNTLKMALTDAEEKDALLRIRKTAKVVENLEQARDIMNLTNAKFEATAEQWRIMASKYFTEDELKKYVRMVIDVPVGDEEFNEVPTRTKNIVEAIHGYASTSEDMLPVIRGTYWAAYQGVTRYLSHDAGRNAASRLNSLWFGQYKAVNARALFIGLKMAKGEEVDI